MFTYVRMYVRTHACLYARMYACTCLFVFIVFMNLFICCSFVMCIYVYTYVYICIYTYNYIYIYIYTWQRPITSIDGQGTKTKSVECDTLADTCGACGTPNPTAALRGFAPRTYRPFGEATGSMNLPGHDKCTMAMVQACTMTIVHACTLWPCHMNVPWS